MKRIVLEVDNVIAENWKICGQSLRDKVTKIVSRELKYPIGYARPDENEAWERYKKNLATLPKYLESIKECQNEAVKNGLTQDILDELLKEDVRG
ncbi:hypothetical protein HDC92_001551 [Pedobacter sp. AK017]|uniref:hypothetical protein n=1 Tax=Pedobacter sp. AK017 TaxID=2723073 RepID=UPI001618ECDD|nr:hypothetical protein [Pedobacter sp. AK017]MBB5437877.1 hypothetical protein [Pedobacter sp. AK017]